MLKSKLCLYVIENKVDLLWLLWELTAIVSNKKWLLVGQTSISWNWQYFKPLARKYPAYNQSKKKISSHQKWQLPEDPLTVQWHFIYIYDILLLQEILISAAVIYTSFPFSNNINEFPASHDLSAIGKLWILIYDLSLHLSLISSDSTI